MDQDRRALAGVVLLALVSVACSDSTAPTSAAPPVASLSVVGDEDAIGTSAYLDNLNRQAAAKGLAVSRAELLLASDAPVRTPRLLFANDRSLRTPSRWVSRDIRRLAPDATLSYDVFAPLAQATVGGSAQPAFDNSFATWNAVSWLWR